MTNPAWTRTFATFAWALVPGDVVSVYEGRQVGKVCYEVVAVSIGAKRVTVTCRTPGGRSVRKVFRVHGSAGIVTCRS